MSAGPQLRGGGPVAGRTARGERCVVQLATSAATETLAAAQLRGQLAPKPVALTVLFCSTHYDLGRLARALPAHTSRSLVGAATGRVIGRDGFQAAGISGFQLPAGRFRAAHRLIEDVARFGLPEAREIVRALRRELGSAGSARHLFGILLVDAGSRCEERLVAAIGTELGGVPLVGGSAGDLYFNPLAQRPGSRHILYGSGGYPRAAALCLVASQSAIAAFSHNHYTPGPHRLVITAADPARRLVHEIDGIGALAAYAAACGLRKPPASADLLSSRPLMIRIGGQYFARGMQRVCAGGALEFACAMEAGMVVTVARPADLFAQLESMFGRLQETIGPPELVIGFDCAARTVSMERAGLTAAVEEVFRRNAVVGFSTLGEQFNTIHVNNSFTCLGIAAVT